MSRTEEHTLCSTKNLDSLVSSYVAAAPATLKEILLFLNERFPDGFSSSDAHDRLSNSYYCYTNYQTFVTLAKKGFLIAEATPHGKSPKSVRYKFLVDRTKFTGQEIEDFAKRRKERETEYYQKFCRELLNERATWPRRLTGECSWAYANSGSKNLPLSPMGKDIDRLLILADYKLKTKQIVSNQPGEIRFCGTYSSEDTEIEFKSQFTSNDLKEGKEILLILNPHEEVELSLDHSSEKTGYKISGRIYSPEARAFVQERLNLNKGNSSDTGESLWFERTHPQAHSFYVLSTLAPIVIAPYLSVITNFKGNPWKNA